MDSLFNIQLIIIYKLKLIKLIDHFWCSKIPKKKLIAES